MMVMRILSRPRPSTSLPPLPLLTRSGTFPSALRRGTA